VTEAYLRFGLCGPSQVLPFCACKYRPSLHPLLLSPCSLLFICSRDLQVVSGKVIDVEERELRRLQVLPSHGQDRGGCGGSRNCHS
jgi:hypothetical protein